MLYINLRPLLFIIVYIFLIFILLFIYYTLYSVSRTYCIYQQILEIIREMIIYKMFYINMLKKKTKTKNK